MLYVPRKIDDKPLHIYILSNSRSLYSTKRFFEECVKKGHKAKVYPPSQLTLLIEKDQCQIYFQQKPIPVPDIIIPRVGQNHPNYNLAIIKQFEIMGATTLNPVQAIIRSRDKLRSLQLLAQNGIPVPKTYFLNDVASINQAISTTGGAPTIIKITSGTQGVGVILSESIRSARSVLETMISQEQYVIVQEFIQESSGRDKRAIVLGDKVVATMERISMDDEFRANIHRGATHSKVELSIEAAKMARLATKILGLNFAGVDLIESNRGPLILEVNPSPGIEGIEAATQLNIAEFCVQYLEKKMKPGMNIKKI